MWCSDSCRANFANIRSQLTELVQLLEAGHPPDADFQQRARDLAVARWHLQRFRPIA